MLKENNPVKENETQEQSSEAEVLRLPQTLHATLLELNYQKVQIDKQMGTIVQTFFVTKELDPKLYQINLEQNIIQLKPVVLPPKTIEGESDTNEEKED
tara:strand:+ start:1187 stop:1483 length:297 start_codon:yes stop_codon:yes gene_type:complete